MRWWAIGLGMLAALAFAAVRSTRVEVTGDSMRPTLETGDRLLVWRTRRVRPGQLVVVPDPREPGRPLVKRLAERTPDGRVVVRGDNATASTDSRVFGVLDACAIEGRPWYRYHPPGREGVVGAGGRPRRAGLRPLRRLRRRSGPRPARRPRRR